jgi:N-acetylmuramoyl-L-alanine amidase CwlA
MQSNRIIAQKTGTHHTTVKTRRDELSSTGEISQLKKTIGKDGKARTTAPKISIKPNLKKEKSKPSSPQERETDTINFKSLKDEMKEIMKIYITNKPDSRKAYEELIAELVSYGKKIAKV